MTVLLLNRSTNSFNFTFLQSQLFLQTKFARMHENAEPDLSNFFFLYKKDIKLNVNEFKLSNNFVG